MWQPNHVTTMHGNTSTHRHWYASQMNASCSIRTEPGFVGISSSLKRTTLQKGYLSPRCGWMYDSEEGNVSHNSTPSLNFPPRIILIASATISRVSGSGLATVSLSPPLFSCLWFKLQADFTVRIDQNGRGHDGWPWREIRRPFPRARPGC